MLECSKSRNIKVDSSSFERVEEFKYLGTYLSIQISIQEEIKSKWKSENACYYFVQNLSASRWLTKNIKIKIYRTRKFACYFVWV
jgi:hypothetical protein